MKAVIIQFPGTNREGDMLAACEKVGIEASIIWHKQTALPQCDLVILPGGFSYGDYLRCGAMAANSPIMQDIITKANAESKTPLYVLGICNGFQILCETGLLEGALLYNQKQKFICKKVTLRVQQNSTVFTKKYAKGQIIQVPIAHGEGNYFADDTTLKMLEDENRVIFRYVNANGDATEEANPNGSRHNIAGIINKKGNILGMMPHPENYIEMLQGGIDGLGLFQSIKEVAA
jgi:phosphoribosylformylglycinamidine synthase